MDGTAITGPRGVLAAVPWLRRLSRTTPGVIVVLAVTIAALCTTAGVVVAAQLDERINHHQHLLDHSEPVTYAAQNLYADLSAADAAAASAFLSGGIQPQSMRSRYEQALAGAAGALADATAGATDRDTRSAMAQITDQLTLYAGLVEAARANNLQGFPIGSAYLREASALMQTKILPDGERIFTNDLEAMKRDQDAVSSTPVAGLVLLGLCLIAVCVGTLWMAARTHRQFNVGLVATGALVLAVAGWLAVASQLAADDIARGRIEGTTRFSELTQARILASKARTEETLQLIAHGDPTPIEKEFRSTTDQLTALLAGGPAAASTGVHGWTDSHGRQVDAYLSGDYQRAVDQAIGSDPTASAAMYSVVESSLLGEIEEARDALRDRVAAAGNAFRWAPVGTLALMVVAATATVAGLWPRLKEFL